MASSSAVPPQRFIRLPGNFLGSTSFFEGMSPANVEKYANARKKVVEAEPFTQNTKNILFFKEKQDKIRFHPEAQKAVVISLARRLHYPPAAKPETGPVPPAQALVSHSLSKMLNTLGPLVGHLVQTGITKRNEISPGMQALAKWIGKSGIPAHENKTLEQLSELYATIVSFCEDVAKMEFQEGIIVEQTADTDWASALNTNIIADFTRAANGQQVVIQAIDAVEAPVETLYEPIMTPEILGDSRAKDHSETTERFMSICREVNADYMQKHFPQKLAQKKKPEGKEDPKEKEGDKEEEAEKQASSDENVSESEDESEKKKKRKKAAKAGLEKSSPKAGSASGKKAGATGSGRTLVIGGGALGMAPTTVKAPPKGGGDKGSEHSGSESDVDPPPNRGKRKSSARGGRK